VKPRPAAAADPKRKPPADAPPAEAAPAEPAPAPAPEPDPVPGEPNAAAVRSMWSTVRDKVRQRSRTTEVMLAGATVHAIEDNTLVLTHDSAPLAKRLSEQRNADVIAEALKDALGVNWRVRCEVGAPTLAVGVPPAGGNASPVVTRPAVPRPVVPKMEAPVPDVAEPTDRGAVPDDDEEGMLAEAGRSDPSAPRRDPEEVALELLQNELGARRIDGG
jgi:DNA polymerase III subunit gamma/tau